MPLKIDPSSEGLSKVFRDYQEEALKYVWKNGGDGVTSRQAWQYVNESFDGSKTISRASIINFLNDMVDEGILDYFEKTGKGGYHRVYTTKLDEKEFRKFLAETVLSSLLRDFPTETREVVKNILN